MRRSADDAILALRQQVRAWADRSATPDVRVLVYPPEREAEMLARLPQAVDDMAAEGPRVDLVDLGRVLLDELRRSEVRLARLRELERESSELLLHDLGVIGTRAVTRLLQPPLPEGVVCRLAINTGALAAFVSYAAITNELHGSVEHPSVATVLAFPGEADERSLNLLGLRVDTNYRVARI